MATKDSKYIPWDSPAVEPHVPDEAQLQAELASTIRKTQQHNFSLHRRAFRATHVKTQGIVKGTFTVSPNLPPELAQGICSAANRDVGPHDVAIRFANEPSFVQDDRAPGPRGCGMRIFGVLADNPNTTETSSASKKSEDSADTGFMHPLGAETHTQDLTFNNAPVLELRDIRTCAEIFGIRERHFRCPANIKSELERRPDADLQLAPTQLPNRHFLSYTMYSQSAYRWGLYVAKYALFPVELTDAEKHDILRDVGAGKMKHSAGGGGGPTMAELEKMEIKDDADPEQHSQWLRSFFQVHSAAYELRVQLCEDVEKQPVEDASVEWDEEKFPFRTVGRVVMPAGQDSFSHARRVFWEEKMGLNVWYGLEAHRPLGSVNRLRRKLYESSEGFREQVNTTKVVPVSRVDQIPD